MEKKRWRADVLKYNIACDSQASCQTLDNAMTREKEEKEETEKKDEKKDEKQEDNQEKQEKQPQEGRSARPRLPRWRAGVIQEKDLWVRCFM